MLSLFSQPRYSTVRNEKTKNLLSIFSRMCSSQSLHLVSAWKIGISRLLCYRTVVTEIRILTSFY